MKIELTINDGEQYKIIDNVHKIHIITGDYKKIGEEITITDYSVEML